MKPFRESYKQFKENFFRVAKGSIMPSMLFDRSDESFLPLYWSDQPTISVTASAPLEIQHSPTEDGAQPTPVVELVSARESPSPMLDAARGSATKQLVDERALQSLECPSKRVATTKSLVGATRT
ncbi:hypothetical protein CR513_55644, partial [Mucuna pruriens]